jgi:broad specificity phosphatase PhoE
LLLLLARHAQSTLNFEQRVNGDPAVAVPLTEQGREEARRLGAQVAGIRLDLCVCSRFGRTQETAELALAGRDVPIEVDGRLDDIKIGDLEGEPIARYREIKRGLGRKQPFPGGECLDDAARRYAAAFRDLAAREVERVLVVCHEIPVRYALNAAAGSNALDGPPFHDLPNAVPFLFDGEALARAAARIEELAA